MTTIHLKTDNKLGTITTAYYISGINKYQKNLIIADHKKQEYTESVAATGIHCKDILLIGSKADATAGKISPYLGTITGPKQNAPRKIIYRDYSKTIEEQKESVWLVPFPEDLGICFKILMQQIKEEYVCIWKKKL